MWSRKLSKELIHGLKSFPCVVLTGPRRAGKTFLLRKLLPQAQYVLLEDPDVLLRVKNDPRAFLEGLKAPVIIDEIQNAPELLPYIRSMIDLDKKHRKGQWLITGSQEFSIMKGVTESMTGRAAIFQLLPLSMSEAKAVSPLLGGFPEVLKTPKMKKTWFRSYLQTYIERDIREIINVKDMGSYRLFMQMLAQRNGQVLNKSDLAAPSGVKVPTITQWLSTLEITNQIYLVKPFYNNFEKRLVKSPKVYFLDSGLLCFMLGIHSLSDLQNSPFAGFVFESFVLSELLKSQINSGLAKEVYFLRDDAGLEIDFIVPRGNQQIELIETKFSKTPVPAMINNIKSLKKNIKKEKVKATLIHIGTSIDGQKLTEDIWAYNFQTYFKC